MSGEVSTTILGREENSGKKYPMIVEKVILLVGLVLFILTFSAVFAQFDNKLLSSLVTFIIYPFVILFTTEMIGRTIQKVHNDT
ncbi:MAG: hypothetical protein ISR22_02225 [Candidatus Poseidoniaceae archaeon]|nr:hypothetical protein [Candidatus Poseidoniaceae archaeon]